MIQNQSEFPKTQILLNLSSSLIAAEINFRYSRALEVVCWFPFGVMTVIPIPSSHKAVGSLSPVIIVLDCSLQYHKSQYSKSY